LRCFSNHRAGVIRKSSATHQMGQAIRPADMFKGDAAPEFAACLGR
jgi:hypothetical protein